VDTDTEGQELDLLQQGDRLLLKGLYKKYRPSFLKWVQRQYPGFVADAPDIYQQAFTIVYFNVKAGKFTGIESTVQTYLFGIGKNLFNKKIAQQKNQPESLDVTHETSLPSETILAGYETTHQRLMVKNILENVGEPCKTILTKYYFDNYTMEAIADSVGYKSAAMAKKKKCECLVKIRKTLLNKKASTTKQMEENG
jgi:RNA polymerase sigma factor (sigma-70 family)